RRFGARLPDAGLRQQAQRRVIRLHIAASPLPEVRDNARAVEDTVLAQGRYPVSSAEHPPVRATLDPQRVPLRGVLVRQEVMRQTVTLLGYSGDRPGVSVLPEVALRGALQI